MKLKFLKTAFFCIACIFSYGNFLYASSDDSLVISEFMAINSSILQDEDGEYSDWIEIYNPGTDTVDLLAWSLTDRIDEPAKWVFPKIMLPPDTFIVVFASGKDRRDPQEKHQAGRPEKGDHGQHNLCRKDPEGHPATH